MRIVGDLRSIERGSTILMIAIAILGARWPLVWRTSLESVRAENLWLQGRLRERDDDRRRIAAEITKVLAS